MGQLKPKHVQMKKILLPAIFAAAALSANAQVLNGSFENWSKLILFEHPVMGTDVISSNYVTFFESNGALGVTRVNGQTGGALRVQNVFNGEYISPGWFITGTAPQQEGEGLIFGEGFPVSDPNISGITLDLRYNIPSSSPGFILVQFKNNGEPVGMGNMGPGTHMMALEGESDWQQVQFDFNAPGAPVNECVIALVCADVLNDDGEFTPGAFLEADNLMWVNSQNTIPGGDFELWSHVPPIDMPDDVVVDIDPFASAYAQSNDAANGNHSLQLSTIQRNGWVQVGRAWMAAESQGEVVPNIMLNGTQTNVSFQYKYGTPGNDVAAAHIYFYQQNQDGWNPVYYKLIELNANGGWEMVDYNFSTELEQAFVTADAMAILFESSKYVDGTEATPGSILLVDDVKLGGAMNLFAMSNAVKGNIKVWPNPTLARATFDLTIPRTGFYRVFNEQGAQIAIKEFSSERYITHDLFNQPSGKYIFRFTHNGGTQVAQVIKL
jgi:hypothetical protein